MEWLTNSVINYLRENPDLDEDLFMSEYHDKLRIAVDDLQEERRKEYVPALSEILITNKERINNVVANAHKYFGREYSTPNLDAQTIYNIIANEIKYDDSHLVCKKGSIYLIRQSQKPLTVSPYGHELMAEICCAVTDHYRNDDYLDSKSCCLNDCYRDLVQDALHIPEIRKEFLPDWEWKEYSESESDSESDLDLDDPIETTLQT